MPKNTHLWVTKISDVLFLMIPVSLLYDIHLNSYNIAFFLIFYLLIEKKVIHFRFVLPCKWLLIFSSLYLIEIFGLLYTKDLYFGFELLKSSSVLVLFPLFLPTYLKERGTRCVGHVLSLFIASLFIISLYTFLKLTSSTAPLSSDHRCYFRYEIPHKYVYFGMYLNFGFWTMIYCIYNQGAKISWIRTFVFGAFAFGLLFFLYYSGGKATLLSWMLVLILFILLLIPTGNQNYKFLKIFSSVTLAILIIGALMVQNSKLKDRLLEQWETTRQNYSVAERIPLWKCAVQTFKKNSYLV